MTIRDLLENGIELQGTYCIKRWCGEYETYTTLAEGHDFECEVYKIKSKYLDAYITYLYVADNKLNIVIRYEGRLNKHDNYYND